MSAQLTPPPGAPTPNVDVLGPVRARSGGAELALGGPRQVEVLARLVAARGRVVPVRTLIADLWEDPSAGATAAVRTFVAALRRALEPDRPPRAPARVIRTEGSGYRLDLPDDHIDARHVETLLRRAAERPWTARADLLEDVVALWRGPAFGDFHDRPWAAGEVARLDEIRCTAVEMLAESLIQQVRPEQAIAELETHLHEFPGREQAWILQARALRRAGRAADASALLHRARTRIREEFGTDPSPRLAAVEREIHTEPDPESADDRIWREAVSAHAVAGRRSRITASADLLRALALTDGPGLIAAQDRRADAIEELAAFDDPELTATVLTRVEVPGVWSCLDDPARSARLVAVARECLDRFDAETSPALRARLLALIAIESRGRRGTFGVEASVAAETAARELGDPGVLAVALDARFLQSFHTLGGWAARAAIGHELIATARRHDLSTYRILGHLIALQAAAAAGDVVAADEHAHAADTVAVRHERDLVGVFTTWYRALRTVLTDQPPAVITAAYDRAIGTLPGCGMPGVSRGLEPLTRLCVALRTGSVPAELRALDFGPNAEYAHPLLADDADRSRALLRAAPAPPPDHLAELRWALLGLAAAGIGDREIADRVRRALAPARGELIGAGTGLLSLGPVSALLDRLAL